MSQSSGHIPACSCFSGRCFKISKWIPFTYGPCTFHSGVSVWFSVWASWHKPFKNRFSIPCSSIVFPGMSSIAFQSQVFWGLASPVQDLGVGMPDVKLKSLLLRENIHTFVIPPNCRLPQLGCGFFLGKPICLPFLPILMLSFYPWLWRLCLSSFQIPFRGCYSIHGCRFVVSVGGGKFRIFLCCHLEQCTRHVSFYLF